ncbi:hypothetical protein LDFHOB_00935 [Candidatus Electronema aureum]
MIQNLQIKLVEQIFSRSDIALSFVFRLFLFSLRF